MIFGGKALL